MLGNIICRYIDIMVVHWVNYSGSWMGNNALAFAFCFSGVQQYILDLEKCNIKSNWKTLIAFLVSHGFSSIWLLNWIELRPIRSSAGAYSHQHRPRWKVHIGLKVSLKCMNEWKYLFFICTFKIIFKFIIFLNVFHLIIWKIQNPT